jgi:hypothetical protein
MVHHPDVYNKIGNLDALGGDVHMNLCMIYRYKCTYIGAYKSIYGI